MAKPKLPIPVDLLKTLAKAKPIKPVERGKSIGRVLESKVKVSTKPAKITTMAHTRSSNRGK